MKWKEWRWWLCLILDIHTKSDEVRYGRHTIRHHLFGAVSTILPYRRCKYCGEIVDVGSSAGNGLREGVGGEG